MVSQRALEIRSVEDIVYETLRDLIVWGEYAPGHRLHLGQLAEELEVSTMPVRGAIAKLTNEGLVQSKPRRAAVVAPLILDEYLEIQDLRIGIESAAARHGALHMDARRLGEMKRILAELETKTDLESIVSLEWDAYVTLYAAPGRQRTVGLVREYARLTERYIRLLYARDFRQAQARERLARVIAACERGEADAVAELIAHDMRDDAQRVTAAFDGSLDGTTLENRKEA
jgi:DNA-binding GntR family transcriptional regulator